MHINDQITGEKFPRGFSLFAFFDFRDAFGRKEHVVNHVAHLFRFDAFQNVLAHFVFLTGKHMHHVPLIFRCERLSHTSISQDAIAARAEAVRSCHFPCASLSHKSVQSGEEVHNIHQDKIEQRHVPTEQQHRDRNHDRRVHQFLVAAESLFLWVPRPRTFLQLDLHLAEEAFDFGHHCFATRFVRHTPGGTRTPNRRFWRPLLYQLSYWRIFNLPLPFTLPFPHLHLNITRRRRRGRGRLLIQNVAHATRADGFAAFANCEPNGLLHGYRRDQLNLDRDVIAGHHHFHAIRQFDRAGDISRPEIKLRPVIGEERSVTSAFLLAQDVNFRFEFLVRRNGAGLGDYLSALDLFLLETAQQHTDIIARACFIEELAEHLDIRGDGLRRWTNANELDFPHFLENPSLDTTGRNGAAAFNVEHVFDRHQERLINRPIRHRHIIIDRLDKREHLLLRVGLAVERLERAAPDDRNFVTRKFVLRQQIAHFHLDKIEKLGIVHHVDFVEENDDGRHAHLPR